MVFCSKKYPNPGMGGPLIGDDEMPPEEIILIIIIIRFETNWRRSTFKIFHMRQNAFTESLRLMVPDSSNWMTSY